MEGDVFFFFFFFITCFLANVYFWYRQEGERGACHTLGSLGGLGFFFFFFFFFGMLVCTIMYIYLYSPF